MKVAINGFGRIGRMFYKAWQLNADKIEGHEIAAINDLGDEATLKHLLKYDSSYGYFEDKLTPKFLAEKDPAALPWREMGVDIVIESTGRFTKKEDAKAHIEAGAKLVIISAPAEDADATIVLGVNEEIFDPAKHEVISMASCTTNCIAPILKVMDEKFKIKRGFMTTIHAYTNDQNLQDAPHKDLRRARAAAENIVPTSTGAAKAIGVVLPQLKGKLDGIAIRVPTPVVSLSDLILELDKKTTVEEVNKTYKEAAEGDLKNIMEYTKEELVSNDFKGNPHSAIVDSKQTKVIDGTLLKTVGWYDNEWGYSCRLVDMVGYIGKKIKN